ncbi:hypothetical protein E1281_22355 [Actinomadura sp. KC345]|uniref:hypothetical protein n=1 Tax=Actinomadura sp. KC345 TaxID=2530371 RepID=UPI00104963DC|nr:hypothetical protein [Actinomadura sp. KC345]TDC50230.1 hypothetical protein E1281_22355 [Actinomadura sp. KC345]
MRVLMVAYYWINDGKESMIGVHKRCLRVGTALAERGHEVLLAPHGMKLPAEEPPGITFVELPFTPPRDKNECFGLAEEGSNRLRMLDRLTELAPDLLVIGEAPLSGMFLETAMCTAELDLPTVIFDNAYGDFLAEQMWYGQNGFADAMVLTGPTSFHWSDAPRCVRQVAPFVDDVPDAAEDLLDDLGIHAEPLVTIFAYDTKVERVALDVAASLDADAPTLLFLSRDPEKLRARLDDLRPHVQTHVIAPPADPVLFDLLRRSQLAIVKHGFMQITEAVSLGTPVLSIRHNGAEWMAYTPDFFHQFVAVTPGDDLNKTLAEIGRLLALPPEEVAKVHSGPFQAAEQVAAFLEEAHAAGRRDKEEECEARGFTFGRVTRALRHLVGPEVSSVHTLRATRINASRQRDQYALYVGYTANGTDRSARLVGTLYSFPGAAHGPYAADHANDRSLYTSPDGRIVLGIEVLQT